MSRYIVAIKAKVKFNGRNRCRGIIIKDIKIYGDTSSRPVFGMMYASRIRESGSRSMGRQFIPTVTNIFGVT